MKIHEWEPWKWELSGHFKSKAALEFSAAGIHGSSLYCLASNTIQQLPMCLILCLITNRETSPYRLLYHFSMSELLLIYNFFFLIISTFSYLELHPFCPSSTQWSLCLFLHKFSTWVAALNYLILSIFPNSNSQMWEFDWSSSFLFD